ncbi:MAG TPA: hypothetical protein DCE41_16275 [Cytophagales bacterium]|nr:hypothetical protein [Cytophagales bacterium]HAA19461.1 hypothetical protein [Cytophagales bacterium]HAP58679.1 hypothetical protein [Cytophagales bacterium]
MSQVDIGIDAGRLLFGLSRIGYTTTSAICDIIDNSVRAQAKNIHLIINKERDDLADSRRNNVSEYVIIDDGSGMNDNGILEALKLGASDAGYEENSLSKFGLGLKSAAFSQADLLQVISSDGTGFNKYWVNLEEVIQSKKYFATKGPLDESDNELVHKYLPKKKGTIVRLSKIRKVNHPSVKNTIKELTLKTGVIYYYFIAENNLNIYLTGNKVTPIDPLFTDEADTNLDETVWDGTKVKWIEKEKSITIDGEEGIQIKIEATQLPHPPTFNLKEPGTNAAGKIRDKYLIGSGNYGFYVYRNKRLISWASRLEGIIPMDQDFFSFRGRILIDDSADDYFNIDVKKANLTLSDEAFNSISDFIQEGKAKSKKAWLRAGTLIKEITNKKPNEVSNNIVDDFEQIDLLPGDKLLEEGEAKERIEKLSTDMAKLAKNVTKMYKEDLGEEVSDDQEFTEEDIKNAIKGDNPSAEKIFRVSSVEDNNLFEPYWDTDKEECVRINKYHRFSRLIFEENGENAGLQIIFELMLLQFAESEIYAYKNIPDSNYDEIKRILTEYRRISSEFLANMVRKLDGQLPPNFGSNETN